MQTSHEVLGLYLHLARASEQRQRWLVRDKMLVLAAATAAEMGLATVAAFCREKVLQHNTGHLVGHFTTIEAALEDEDFQVYLNRLRRRYSRERAEHILGTLGISQANERNSYYTDYEYAAALMGKTPEELDRRFSQQAGEVGGDGTQGGIASVSQLADEPELGTDAISDSGVSHLEQPSARTTHRLWAVVGVLLVAFALFVVAIVWYFTAN